MPWDLDIQVMLEHEELTAAIIAAAIEVQRKLGTGFLESIYGNAMHLELRKRNIGFQRQKEILVFYDEQVIGKHRLDLIVEDTIVVELKAVRFLYSCLPAFLIRVRAEPAPRG